ncbi:DUF2157 domain-containing protein [Myroides sp. LJL116]
MEAKNTVSTPVSELDHSQIPSVESASFLQRSTLQDNNRWEAFFNYFLLVSFVGFFCSGVVFFFGFNWQELAIGYKYGIILLAIFTGVYVYVFTKLNDLVKDCSLLSSSILIGVLFAVFGQYYHLQPDSYLLFTLWALAILPWTLFSGFALQWVLLGILTNVSLYLFADQQSWGIGWLDTLNSSTIMCLSNSLFYGLYYLQSKALKNSMSFYVDNLLCAIITLDALYTLNTVILEGFSNGPRDFVELIIGLAWLCFLCMSSLKNKSTIKYSLFVIGGLITVFCIVVKVVDLSDLNYLIYGVYWILAAVFSHKIISNRITKWQNGK